MTREEAIKGFEDMKKGLYPFYPDEYFDMAIRALEQEQKFIAKSDGTIEQIKNCNDCIFKKEWEKIGKLLSVVLEKQTKQEPKTGHWIAVEMEKYSDTYGHFTTHEFKCSNCGGNYIFNYHKYCPNCGAKMAESEE